jgi:Thiamine monophosphate synthase
VFADTCRRHGRLLAVNDRADVALAAGSDVLHLGQDDLPVPVARRILGPGVGDASRERVPPLRHPRLPGRLLVDHVMQCEPDASAGGSSGPWTTAPRTGTGRQQPGSATSTPTPRWSSARPRLLVNQVPINRTSARRTRGLPSHLGPGDLTLRSGVPGEGRRGSVWCWSATVTGWPLPRFQHRSSMSSRMLAL